jgi:hypothetical protein
LPFGLSLEAQLHLWVVFSIPAFATLELCADHRREPQQGTGWIFLEFEEQGLMRQRRKE